MQHGCVIFPDVNVLFPDAEQNRDVFLGDNVTFAEHCAFADAPDNLGNVVTEHLTDRIFRFH